MTRIFKIVTETPDGKVWTSYRKAAKTATEALEKARKEFSSAIGERLLEIELLASED